MNLQNLGERLQAVGENFAGRGNQYRTSKAYESLQNARLTEMERARVQQMEQERKQAFLEDAYRAHKMITEDQRPDLALQLLENRMKTGILMGLDMSDTAQGVDMLRAGKVDDFVTVTGSILQRAQAAKQEWDDPITGSDGRRYAIDKANPGAGYQLVPGQGDVTFNAPTPYQKEQLRLREEEQRMSRNAAARAAQELPPKLQEYQLAQDAIFQKSAAAKTRMDDMARNYLALQNDMTSGLAGKFEETLKRVTGSEDPISLLRSDFTRLRNEVVIDSLPPGVASDPDIRMAREPFPDATSSPQYVSSFLRGMSKLESFKNAEAQYNLDYVAANRSVDGKNRWWKMPIKTDKTDSAGKPVTTTLSEIYWVAAQKGVPVPFVMETLGVNDPRIMNKVGY